LLVTPGVYPRRKHLKGTPVVLALALPSNSKPCVKRVSKDKPSSFLDLVVSDKGNFFITLTPAVNKYLGCAEKNIFVLKRRITS
jgi:hypothetical protein